MQLLIDSASLYYRSYYALPESMTAPDGRPHNAVRGFLSTMARLVRQYECSHLVCAWDADWRPAWRVDLLPSYKAHRVVEESASLDGVTDGSTNENNADRSDEETPESLGPQVDALASILDAMGVRRPWAVGFEADDVLATLATQATEPCIVVSGDRDLVQLVDDRVRVLLTVNGGMEKWPLLAPTDVVERFGVPADRYVDLAVLRGDPSDGLPGVAGIGAKTAAALVQAWPDLAAMISACVDPKAPLTPRRAQSILEAADYLRAAEVVATAVRDAPVDEGSMVSAPDPRRLEQLVDEWGVERQVRDLVNALESVAG